MLFLDTSENLPGYHLTFRTDFQTLGETEEIFLFLQVRIIFIEHALHVHNMHSIMMMMLYLVYILLKISRIELTFKLY
jgi:hypothetical protein